MKDSYFRSMRKSKVMKDSYFKSMMMVGKLHGLLLDVVKFELDRMNVRDITNTQCVILYNVGEEVITISEFVDRGYYLGTNVSYSLEKMIQNGYVIKESSDDDRRCKYAQLSPKGLDLFHKIDALIKTHSDYLEKSGVSPQENDDLKKTLRKVESVLQEYIFKLKTPGKDEK